MLIGWIRPTTLLPCIQKMGPKNYFCVCFPTVGIARFYAFWQIEKKRYVGITSDYSVHIRLDKKDLKETTESIFSNVCKHRP